jgi:Ca2+-binding EF-hand superfamily protein
MRIKSKHQGKAHHKHSLRHKLHMKQEEKPEPIPMRLPDENRDGFCEFSEFVSAMKNKAMTHGELRAIFRVVDKNDDNKIHGNEWFNFHRIFVEPFEQCDADKDVELSKEELTKCFETSFNHTKLL